MPQPAPYGSWKSPISANLVATSSVTFGQIVTDGADIYWIEQRPAEGGRHVVVRRASGGAITDVTPLPFSARTRVHEYGGGAFTVADGMVYFANDKDQQLYRLRPGSPPERLTAQHSPVSGTLILLLTAGAAGSYACGRIIPSQ